MPMEATSLALLYDRDLFRQAGLDSNHPPQNWDELYEYAMKLSIEKDGDGKIDQYQIGSPAGSTGHVLGQIRLSSGQEIGFKPDILSILFEDGSGIESVCKSNAVWTSWRVNRFLSP